MRNFALIVGTALLASCSNFTWTGQNAGVSDDEAARGLKDPATLARAYESDRYWRGIRRRIDGRSNALTRDFGRITETIDRHVFNYSADDPYVNYQTDANYFDATLSGAGAFAGLNTLPWLPVN